MEEVRGGDTNINSPDTQDTADTEDIPDTTGTPADVPPDASIRKLFLAAQEQGLTVDDLRNVNVYLFDRVRSEMNDLLAEVNYRAMKQRGDEVQITRSSSTPSIVSHLDTRMKCSPNSSWNHKLRQAHQTNQIPELDIRFDELNARHKREHGHPIEKNRDYYPAVIKAALENKDIEDVLDF